MSRRAKDLIAAALSWSGTDFWVGRRSRSAPLILGYHRVVDDASALSDRTLPGMAISKAMLRSQLEWVGRRYRITTLDEIGDRLEHAAPCGNLAAITFDDGYRSVHDHALPLLQEMGLPGAVFVITSLIRKGARPMHDRLYSLVSEAIAGKRALPPAIARALCSAHAEPEHATSGAMNAVRDLLARPSAELRDALGDDDGGGEASAAESAEVETLDWNALAALQRAGFIIGSHTRTHAFLDHEDDATLRDELQRSRAELESGLGTEVRHFAYPDGRFSPRVVRAVEDAGYRFGYTICDHRHAQNPLLTIQRVMLWERSCQDASGRFSSSLMHCHAAAVLPFPPPCHHDHGASSGPSC